MKKSTAPCRVRIISGKWRSRILRFPDILGLRPTPDRVRETLFNWLSSYIYHARCLDLFAGSGALGFEALSRGAKSVLMVDKAPQVITQLRENAKLLAATEQVEFYCGQAPSDRIPVVDKLFDIVFLDPPFHQNMLKPCCEWLEKNHCLAPQALIYVEVERGLDPLPIPAHWTILRSQKAGQVGYYLLQVNTHG